MKHGKEASTCMECSRLIRQVNCVSCAGSLELDGSYDKLDRSLRTVHDRALLIGVLVSREIANDIFTRKTGMAPGNGIDCRL